MALITQAEVEAKLGRSLTSEETSAFNSTNLALQSYIERMIGSDVEEVSETTRVYDGGVQHLKIDPCTDITAVKSIDRDDFVVETILSRDYTAEPVNRNMKTMLRLRDDRFWRSMNNIQVTAKFSIYEASDVLAVVKEAMIDALASELTSTVNIKRESIEGYSVEYSSDQTKRALSRIKFLFPEV
jgi:hypothetical protein